MRTLSTVLLLLALASGAAAAPAQIPLRGTLSDAAGTPIDGTVTVTLSLYAEETGGTALYTETQDVDVDVGRLDTQLGIASALSLDLFAARDEVWLGIKIGDEPELAPRVRLGSVPYAGAAASVPWGGVQGVPDFQRRVTGTCATGAISAVAADGSVTCATLDGGGGGTAGIFPGLGITIDGDSIGVVFGDRANTATEGDDWRLLPEPTVPGGVAYAYQDTWQVLPPGNSGELLHSQDPLVGPPYWGPITAGELPPFSSHYIWNSADVQTSQVASINIDGSISSAGPLTASSVTTSKVKSSSVETGTIFATSAFIDSVSTSSLRIGAIGKPIKQVYFGEFEQSGPSSESCPAIDFGFDIDAIDFHFDFQLPLATCTSKFTVILPVNFATMPVLLLTARGGDAKTWALSWQYVNGFTYDVYVTRTDLPGGPWSTIFIQYLALMP